jgi:hypothetical protein
MENEKSSIDILKSIAKKNGWDIDIYEKTISSRYGVNERNVLIKNISFNNSFFISAQAANTSKYRLYSGVFTPISLKFDYKLLIRKRDTLDKLSFRKDRLRFKIGNSSFDSKIFVETNNDIQTHKILSSSKVQLEIIEFLNISDLLSIGYNEINPEFTKDLEGQTYLSVFLSMNWMSEMEMINKTFELSELLKTKFN